MDAVPQFAAVETDVDYRLFDQPASEKFSEASDTPDTDSVDEFPPEHGLAVHGLLFVGALTHTVAFAGSHEAVIRTLKGGEEIAVRLVAKDYEGTAAYDIAFTMATLAAAIVTLDGKPLGGQQIQKSGTVQSIAQKFERLRDDYHWEMFYPVVDAYGELKKRQSIALDVLEGKLRAGRIMSHVSAGSHTNRDSSQAI